MSWLDKLRGKDVLEENPKIIKSFEQTKDKQEEKEENDIEKMGATEFEMFGSMEYYYNSIYGTTSDKVRLAKEYREMAMFPEVADALDEICDEAIVPDDEGEILSLRFDDETLQKNKNKVKNLQKEFDFVINKLLSFNDDGFNLFRKFYVEGELYGEMVINPKSPKQGIKKIVFLPPETITPEYDEYNNIKGFIQKVEGGHKNGNDALIKFSSEQISYVNSGIFSTDKRVPLSFIERAKVAYRQLKWMEDALIIYRIVRAPERRVFTVDVGNLPKKKAEEYMNNIIKRYKQKKIYNPQTGEIDVGKQVLSMIEDFWLPKRADGSGPSVETLDGGSNLGEIDDVIYFVKKLYKALKIPTKRMDEESSGGVYQPNGKSGEIDRDEIKFAKYVVRVRQRFIKFLTQIFVKHLQLTGLWKQYKLDEDMFSFIFNEENEWRETKKLENFRERLDIFREAKDHSSDPEKAIYAIEWLQKEILKMSDEDIEENRKLIEKDRKEKEETEDKWGAGDEPEETDGDADGGGKPPKKEPEVEPEAEPEDGDEEEPEEESTVLNT
jgi:hypothetical protein